jgi:hypothetical protein
MDGAAQPDQRDPQPEDRQGKTIKEIQVEVDIVKNAMEDNILKITQRGETLDDLQHKTGMSLPVP